MMYYNFLRIHKTLRVTPAMAAGVSDKLWEIGDIAELVEDAEILPKNAGVGRDAFRSLVIPMVPQAAVASMSFGNSTRS